MKIIHIHPSQLMSEKFVMPLVKKEKSLGFKTIIINFKNENLPYKNTYFNLNLMNLNIIQQSVKFIFFILKEKPDIVFCHNTLQSFIPLILLRSIGLKKIIYFNHGVTFIGYTGINKLIFYMIEKLNVSLAYKTITVSKEMKSYLDKLSNNVSIINNGSACGININNLVKKNLQNIYVIKKN